MRELTTVEALAAIEGELRKRLERDRARRAPHTPDPRAATGGQRPCLWCQGVSLLDAEFCAHCGTRVNAAVHSSRES